MGSAFVSPLRYPGGKGVLAPFLGQLILSQQPPPQIYVEPFAGGAGAAVRLLVDEYVERIILNDLDAGISAFWRAVFHRTEEFARRIESCRVTIPAWRRHRRVYERGSDDDLELGFSTFFLNRTNRSGIVRARPIGGMEQSGQWKIDARFNRKELAARVRRLGEYRNRVTVCEIDGVDFLRNHLGDPSVFAYIDPPYIEKARGLYLDTLAWTDHERLAEVLREAEGRWLLTYDHDERVADDLYVGSRCIGFDIAHTAAHQYVGQEYAVFSDSLRITSFNGLRVDQAAASALLA